MTHESTADPVVHIHLEGRIEASEAQDFLKSSRELASSSPRSDVAVDLSEVEFLASSGVGSLICLSEELSRDGRTMYVVAPSEAVTSVLELLNLKRLLHIVPTVPESSGA